MSCDNNSISLQLSDFDSPDEVYELLWDNEVSSYRGEIDILSDILTLNFETEAEKETALDVLSSINYKIERF